MVKFHLPGPPRTSLLFRNLLLLIFCSDVLNVSGRFNTKDSTDVVSVGDEKSREPYFEVHTTDGNKPGSPQNVSALIGKTAFLSCVVKNLGKSKSVTWIRHRDVHILTVGEYTYTTDERFMSRHNRDTDEWVLVIKYVQERDAGIYECQIPSSVPRSYPINLNIVVPHVRIQGSPDIHVDQGSVINLTCIISYSPEPPVYVFWYKGESVVAYDSENGRVEVITKKGRETTHSHLVIYKASPLDSGNYTCKPSIARSASIKVHVLESEFPDALHESGVSSAWSNSFIGKFLSASNSRMEGRESNYMSFNETSLYSIASFKFMTFSFLFLFAHLILLNIVGIFLFGRHHEGYDHLITQQKQLFSCVSTKQEKMSVVSANIKTPTSDVMPRSNSNTHIYCLKRRCLVDSRKAPFEEENKTSSNPFSITFNPNVGSALTFEDENQSSKLAQIPITSLQGATRELKNPKSA